MIVKSPGGESVMDRALVTSRIIDAQRDRVYVAFSDPAQLACWWGPKGFRNTFHEFNLRPGGKWRFVMHGPNGIDYENESLFIEIAPYERVILRHISAPQFELTVTFEEVEGKTRVGWTQLFNTAAECQRVARFAVEANEQNLDRLAALVGSKSTSEK